MRSNPKIHLSDGQTKKFRTLVWNHYYREGRHTLPWRKTRDPYRIVVSEIMLQQTQVARVLVFYPKFLRRFPSFRILAKATRRAVLQQWQGLGYNRRAISLHRLAQEIVGKYGGKVPHDAETLNTLPGIGRATAGSIAAFAYQAAVPFVETNIRRTFIHHFFPRARKVREEAILELVRQTLPKRGAREWYYALMDYGSWLAKRTKNPNRRHAYYHPQPKFEGSSRELRGKMVRYLLSHPHADVRTVARALKEPLPHIKKVRTMLEKEGFF